MPLTEKALVVLFIFLALGTSHPCWAIPPLTLPDLIEQEFNVSPVSCDITLVLLSPIRKVEVEVLLPNQLTTYDTIPDQVNEHRSCLAVLLTSENDTEVQLMEAKMDGAKNLHSRLILFTSEPSVFEEFKARRKRTFDAKAVLMSGKDRVEKVEDYLATSDDSWRNVTLSYTTSNPYLFKSSKSGKEDGADVVIWEILRKKLNLSGVKYVNGGSYNGMFTLVVEGKADVVVSQAAISWNRLHLADISYPMFLRSFIFYNRKPGSVTRLLTLTYPFSGRTWLAFLSTILAVIMTMLLTNLQLRRRGHELTLHQAVVVSISPLLSDGVPRHWEHVWRSRYGFLVLLVWLPGGLLLSSAYTSNLLANLISVESEQTVDTFQQLVDNGHMLVLLKNTVLSPLMKNSPRAAVRQAYQKCVVERGGYYSPFFQHPPEIKARLLSGTASEMVPALQVYGLRHLYRVAPETLLDMYVGYHYRWGHPLKQEVEEVVARLTEAGITYFIRDRYLWEKVRPERDYERGNPGEKDVSISLSHLALLWIIFLAGLLPASASFAAEWARKTPQKFGPFHGAAKTVNFIV